MSKSTDRTMTLIRGLSGMAALVITCAIVLGLDGLADHYSAATLAKAPSTIVVASVR